MNDKGSRRPASRRSFIATSLAVAPAFAIVRAPSRAAQFEFKCGSNNAVDHPSSKRIGEMWAAIQQESGGRIHTQFFPNSALGGDEAMFNQLRTGALEFMLLNAGNLASVVPVADISYLGFAFANDDEALRVMNGPLGDYVRQEAAAKGITLLHGQYETGMNQISSGSHPIREPGDLRGFKVRVAVSRILVDLFKALGASATPMSYNELYVALQTKIIDGQAEPLVSFEASKHYEVQKYMSMTNHAWSGHYMASNPDIWKTLPPDLQAIVERNNVKYAALLGKDTDDIDVRLMVQLKAQGIVFNSVNPAPFRSMLGSYYKTWQTTFGTTAWRLLETAVNRRYA